MTKIIRRQPRVVWTDDLGTLLPASHVAAAAGSVTLLPTDADLATRVAVAVENQSSGHLYVRRGLDDASLADHDYAVAAGDTLILADAPYYALQAAWETADGDAVVTVTVEPDGARWPIGGTPTRASFAEIADVAQFENSLFCDYPQSPGLAVAAGLASPIADGDGWAVFHQQFGELCEGWLEIGRLSSAGDVSIGILDNLYGPADAAAEGEIAAGYLSIQPGGAAAFNGQNSPPINLPAGTFQVGDRAGVAQVAADTLRLWRIRAGVLVTLAECDPGIRRTSGWVWFGGTGNPGDVAIAGIAKFGCGNIHP